jgi:hypothetical protein
LAATLISAARAFRPRFCSSVNVACSFLP